MEKIYLFGKKKSRGTFDDFYDVDKYHTLEDAYEANDYVECDFVKDKNGIIYIEAKHSKKPDESKFHKLAFQNCPFGLDVYDDDAGCVLASSLF